VNFDELIAASRAPKKLGKLVNCYRCSQADDFVGVQSALPMRDFAPLMANVTLMERKTAGEVVYRIAGENIVNRLGFNPTGSNFIDLLSADMRKQAATTHDALFAHPCGHYIVYENRYENGRCMISESIMLPMRRSEKSAAVLLLGFHIHHQATGIVAPQKDTALITNIELSEFVDIGSGVPDLRAHDEEAVQSVQ
jgi:hypothetical protein